MRPALLGSFAIWIACASAALAQPPTGTKLPLWPQGAPGAVGSEDRDRPTIAIHKPAPEKAMGAAVVICPGGGYGMLADEHEGTEVADWLNSIGVTGVVLRYRLGPRYHHPAMLQDAQRAIRTVRANATEWGLDPKRVAILGFSAGGHLASTAATHFDAGKPDDTDPIERQSSRPDRAILVYPVIQLEPPYGHLGSQRNLLGEKADKELIRSLTNDLQVTKDTPPTFLAHTLSDTGVPPENSLLFAMALRKSGVPFELHIFERGQHGLGLGTGSKRLRIGPDPAFRAWPKLCEAWLRNQGFLTRGGTGPPP